MICLVKLTSEMSALSGTLSSMTLCGREATERNRSGVQEELELVEIIRQGRLSVFGLKRIACKPFRCPRSLRQTLHFTA